MSSLACRGHPQDVLSYIVRNKVSLGVYECAPCHIQYQHMTDRCVANIMNLLHAGGKLARENASDSSSDEEEEWHDASEELPANSMPAADQSWWEQAGPEDVEQHLLNDIHEKGTTLHLLCSLPSPIGGTNVKPHHQFYPMLS